MTRLRRTILALLFALLLIPIRVDAAAIANVQRTTGGVSNAVAYASNVTAGNHLACAIQTSAAISGVTDSLGQTWTQGPHLEDAPSLFFSAIWYFENTAGGADTVTAANTFDALYAHIFCEENSGLATSGSLDKTAAAIGGGGSHSAFDSTATANTTQADELLFGLSANLGGLTSTWTTPTAERYDDNTAAASRAMSAADQIVSSTGMYSSTGSYSSTTTSDQVILATFKASGSAPAATPTYRGLLGVGK